MDEDQVDDVGEDVPSLSAFVQENILKKNIRTIQYSLQPLDETRRKEVIDHKINGQSSLFLACEHGREEILKYFLEACGADPNVDGWYANDDEQVEVSPLWLSVVQEHEGVVKLLIEHGATINTVCKSGSTPVQAACYVQNIEIVKLLCENGADVNLKNAFSDSCLKDSVDNFEMCELLIKYGADVNYRKENQYSTLHRAIKMGDLPTVELLVKSGADTMVKDFEGNDCLRYAVLTFCPDIVEYLLTAEDAGPGHSADAYDLLGAIAVGKGQYNKAYEFWLKAIYFRTERDAGPSPLSDLPEVFGHVEIPHTIRDLIDLVKDSDKMDQLSLAILDNQLGSSHADTIHAILLQSTALFQDDHLLQAFDLTRYAYSLLTQKYKPLNKLQEFALKQTVQVYERIQLETEEQKPLSRLQEMLDTFRQTIDHIKLGSEIKQNDKDYFEAESKTFENLILHSFDMIYMLTSNVKSAKDKSFLKSQICRLVEVDPKLIHGSSILHLILSRKPKFKFLDTGPRECSHADLVVTRELLLCGCDVNVQDLSRDTPLHTHLKWFDVFNFFSRKIISLFLINGAHIDLCDIDGKTVLALLHERSLSICPVKYHTLQCLAVREIINKKIPYRSDLPVPVQIFIDMHK